jgi:uncharacterized membrane protein YkvA (DUF1232 family)
MRRSSSPRPRLGWFAALARYYKDPSASILGKLVALLAVVYVIVPVDLVPDVPVVGWLDDIGVMGLATAWLARVVARYRASEEEALPEGSRRLTRRPFSVSP